MRILACYDFDLMMIRSIKYLKSKLEEIISFFITHNDSDPFCDEIDIVSQDIPDYYEIIKKPMHLLKIRANLIQFICPIL